MHSRGHISIHATQVGELKMDELVRYCLAIFTLPTVMKTKQVGTDFEESSKMLCHSGFGAFCNRCAMDTYPHALTHPCYYVEQVLTWHVGQLHRRGRASLRARARMWASESRQASESERANERERTLVRLV